MPYDISGRSLFPVSDLLTVSDFPLADYLPLDQINSVFDDLYYTESNSSFDGENLTLFIQLAWEGLLEFAPTNNESFSIAIASAEEGWSSIAVSVVLGPDFSMTLEDISFRLRFSEDFLKDKETGNASELELSGDISISPDGVIFENVTGVSLAPAYVAGTEIVVQADDVRPVFGPINPPGWLTDADSFQGVTIQELTLTIPGEYVELNDGSDLSFTMTQAAINEVGFTGEVSVSSADLENPIEGKIFDFDFRFKQFSFTVVENGLVEACLALDVHLETFDSDSQEKWCAIDVCFNADRDFTAGLSAVQPSEAEALPGALVSVEFESAATFLFTGIRLTQEETIWSLYFSGALQLLIEGAEEWPLVNFDEVGIDSAGNLLLPEGGGIVFATPLVVEWHFVRLIVSKFRFGRPENDGERLQVSLSASVALVEGLPVGASVEGLRVTWHPMDSTEEPSVSLEGIGIEFGVPGTFNASLNMKYVESNGVIEFRGQGSLELTALDIGIEVGVIVGYNTMDEFAFLYLFADAKLLPTGIPIGQTGLSVYGFQGLIAYNMALDIIEQDPVDERYYNLFVKSPIGITAINKWQMSKGDNALGAGVVLGTADKGFSFNVKGLLVVAFPDLTLLLQSRANFLKLKPDLSTSSEGTLDALVVYQAGERALIFDVVAYWGMPAIVEVVGSARAFFNFSDPGAWYLEIGEDKDDKRVAANAIRWRDNWLFTAGFWFRLDSQGVITGVQLDIDLQASKGGFFVKATGTARGEMIMTWNPPQSEGSLSMSGNISAGYKGFSVGVSLSGNVEAQVRRPTYLHARVEACFNAILWEACKSHTFEWEDPQPPLLEEPIQVTSATPRHWTAVIADNSNDPSFDTGIVKLTEASAPTIAPHSVISIQFSKPMIDSTGFFNESAQLPNDGYITIGNRSNYSASYELISVNLTRNPGDNDENIDLWGTWESTTTQYNTALRLHSSERFAHDGSLSNSFANVAVIDYCSKPEDIITCVDISAIEYGYGRLSDGSLYFFEGENQIPSERDEKDSCLRLKKEEKLIIYPPTTISNPVIITVRSGRTDSETRNKVEYDGQKIIITHRDLERECLSQFCYIRDHTLPETVHEIRRGTIITELEEWTVPASAKLLPPNSTYQLKIKYIARLKSPDGNISMPFGSEVSVVREFETSGPPVYVGALNNYISRIYPSAGQRPIYTDYDLSIRFKDDYVPFLYSSVGTSLSLKLFDSGGNPVVNEEGQSVLAPVSITGLATHTRTIKHWETHLVRDKENNCVISSSKTPPSESVNTLRLEQSNFELKKNSQYAAELVSNAELDVALLGWAFTTSNFSTFTDLINRNRRVLPPTPSVGTVSEAHFDMAVRQLGLPSIAYVDWFTVTPIVTQDRTKCISMLFESPEPLGYPNRLEIKIEDADVKVFSNTDQSRLLVLPTRGEGWAATELQVQLTWKRDPGEIQRLSVDGDTSDETITFKVNTRNNGG